MIAGIVLAAGQGRRYGSPKAFEQTDDGRTWAARAAETLTAQGCSPVIVTLPELRELGLGESVRSLVVSSSAGQSASLDAALSVVPDEAVAVVITLVDLPDVDARVVGRVLEAAPPTPTVLARATFGGEPGHPVLIGREHLPGLRHTLQGDQGARDYLQANATQLVECGDLASGLDVDERPR